MRRAMRGLAMTAGMAVLAFSLPIQALAWGMDGHKTVAYIAYELLTDKAKQQVGAILGDASEDAFVNSSTWADDIRKPQPDQPYPGSGPWHYVSIQMAETAYSKAADCPTGDCAVEKIGEFNKQVVDPQVLGAIKKDALRFVIHFVGDVAQPLHACENQDRGGNEVQVVLNGRQTNLHSVWDTGIIKGAWGDIAAHRALLLQRAKAEAAGFKVGAPADWANESHKLAVEVVHPSLGGPVKPGPVSPPVAIETRLVALLDEELS
ncbi:S1/P1 nuclease [Nitrospirillum sp. BR 11164]|uniref:S1/P1 nuclease n=1 Tax=Nitrospirillum sp. BR 11164 TaxID=3104324 RepID=UPI002AFEE94E|nr:S1/P1 nuclease [Nitrospirillum sp. BR 11164]MEA1647830.1 S1/P1 nuclease [Nitrospirillum sp. BR 11164]